MRETCGYQGHVCGYKPVQFISRYMDTNDYCVHGHRVALMDSGEFGPSTREEREAILLFELDRYAEYLKWRGTIQVHWNTIQPFQYRWMEVKNA